MSVKPLRSHKNPDLLIREHVEQVRSAMQCIWSWHSNETITPDIKELCMQLACMHDLGKGSAAFQEYIQDPENYAKDLSEKSHAPLSLLLTVQKAKSEKWNPLDTLLLCACVYGHHKGISPLPYRDGQSGAQSTLDFFGSGKMYRVLPRQIQETDFASLMHETGIGLPEILPDKKTVRETSHYLTKEVFPALHKLPVKTAVAFRLKTQLLFSMLLEADKAFLAAKQPDLYLKKTRRTWNSNWIDRKIGTPENTAVNQLRQKARKAVQHKIMENNQISLYSLTAPTGLGKTLLAADWALKIREYAEKQAQLPPKVIIVLPFLSIIDQTAKVYRELLSMGSEKPDGSWFLTSHSLSSREYDTELEETVTNFFIDTWRTELVITTYDQFLMSLIDPRARYQMRFHNLCDSLIIMDEVQSVPCRMWQMLNGIFSELTDACNSKILLMSATLPPFVPSAKPLLENYQDYFGFRRYLFRFKTQAPREINEFCNEIGMQLPYYLAKCERVLITLNTRKSARMLYDHLKKQDVWTENYSRVPLYFISADVTPKDRLHKIAEIKKGAPCIVVSTQCIEAGVDIDMTRVIRDFAPWDSLVQIAGRCNREGKQDKPCEVQIVDLVENAGGKSKRYSDMIYDDVHLSVTRQLISQRDTLNEDEAFLISEQYFQKLNLAKDTGTAHLERFAYWEEDVAVRELLRGQNKEQHTFLVIEQDEKLLDEMNAANKIEDPWKRRNAWRRLSGRIANISVSVYAKSYFKPEEISKAHLGHLLLNHGYYDSESGLQLESKFADSHSLSLVF